MRVLTKREIKDILKKHKMWLSDEEGGECADFSGADLRGANFMDAKLMSADFSRSNLMDANFMGADLSGASFHDANLFGAGFTQAILENAFFIGADLRYARFYDANLKRADFLGAKLKGAIFERAQLERVLFDDAEKYRLGTILKEPMIGYRKARNSKTHETALITLEVPAGAVVFCINGKDCRTNKAKIISITRNGKDYDNLPYNRVGQELEHHSFNLMYNIENAPGIHFFKTREEAENCVV